MADVKETIGVVTDCLKVNMYKEADIESVIMCKIPCLTEVVIDEEESTDTFYKIYTCAGIGGFCMKKYISIRY